MAAAHADALGGGHELRARLAAKLEEADELRAQVEQGRLSAQQLRLQLGAAGVAEEGLVPRHFKAGSSRGGAGAQQHLELRSMLQWLVDYVDLERHMVFECGGSDSEIQVGGRRVQLRRMATWPLLAGSKTVGFKLSVPSDLQADIAALMVKSRSRGGLDELEVQRLADAWEIVGGEIASVQLGRPTPAIFLIRRGSTQAMIIGGWPEISFAAKAAPRKPLFNPAQHFKQLEKTVQEDCQGTCRPRRTQVCAGDRVETEYNGQWFSGLLQGLDDDMAHVQCDVDAPGVITVAPLACVRPARDAPPVGEKKLPRHMRARSMG